MENFRLRKLKHMDGIDSVMPKNRGKIRWLLVLYDFLVLVCVDFLMLYMHPSSETVYGMPVILKELAVGAVCILGGRILSKSYLQIWRYSDTAAFIRLIVSDFLAGWAYYIITSIIPMTSPRFVVQVSICCLNLLGAIAIRLLYKFMFERASKPNKLGVTLRSVLKIFGRVEVNVDDRDISTRTPIAIVGAGQAGMDLAEDLKHSSGSMYIPVCFIDQDASKIGRYICDLPVFSLESTTKELLEKMSVEEVVIAIPSATLGQKQYLFSYFHDYGVKIKLYDKPLLESSDDGKMTLRSFSIEDLLFRKPTEIDLESDVAHYYFGKTVLISGGGGSIGSELCRQIAKMRPKKLVILDVYENGAYDIQQELARQYGRNLDLSVEILSITDREGLRRVFETYRPNVVLNAAAHKHVPLMEHNAIEAVQNNVFGTLNMVELSEEYGVAKFIMVSTDKAVNPTNVMGATKRMCEMIVQSFGADSRTVFSATRFGNVLGSSGSVIPLFKKQIESGGPITITDKRIIRYFMTIPEASRLVLCSGCMAKQGELFVLDMGKPIRILEMAENMIRLSGLEPYTDIDIQEIGLRPGEKLYEELLIKSESVGKTENDKIYVEKDSALSREEVFSRIEKLKAAVEAGNEEDLKKTLHDVVPTFTEPELVNEKASESEEMHNVKDTRKI